ncbi:DUF169 domain-containing protein [Candidatus Bipolaricaulota bacterium]|nr:DUF169 domain-containing protein [Candidatus Bipolaricaulota bacterium]
MTGKIGIALLDQIPQGIERVASPGRHCTFIGRARKGEILWACGEDFTCPLARFNLGIDPPDESTTETLTVTLAATLVGWGDVRDLETAHRFIAGLSPLPVSKRTFIYAPLDKIPVSPDLVILILNPQEVFRHALSITASTGDRSDGLVGGVGALCGECTALPLHIKSATISVGCEGSRREAFLSPKEMFLAIPYSLYRSTVES